MRGLRPLGHLDPHTVKRIWNRGLPNSGMKAVVTPNFERHDETFDPATGNGGVGPATCSHLAEQDRY